MRAPHPPAGLCLPRVSHTMLCHELPQLRCGWVDPTGPSFFIVQCCEWGEEGTGRGCLTHSETVVLPATSLPASRTPCSCCSVSTSPHSPQGLECPQQPRGWPLSITHTCKDLECS